MSKLAPPIELTTTNSNDHLMPIAVEIFKIRSMFLDHLNSLPCPFNEIVKKHYLARLVRAEDKHMLGEYVPFLLADILQIPNKVVSNFVVPWLVLYEHALLVDDAIDVKGSNWAENILLSQIVFNDFISLWQNRFSKYPYLWQIFCNYHTEEISSVLGELRNNSGINTSELSYSVADVSDIHIMMGRKAALVKFCATALSLEYKHRSLNSCEEIGIDNLCAGIQLLDDLSDSIEDYRESRYTYPLKLGSKWLRQRYGLESMCRQAQTYDEILAAVLLSGVTSEVLNLSCRYLIKGIEGLQISYNSATGRYLRSLVENNSSTANTLCRIIAEEQDHVHAMVLSIWKYKRPFSLLVNDPIHGNIWKQMKDCFQSIATLCN